MGALTRAQCAHGPRPCGRITCRYHLWWDSPVRRAMWSTAVRSGASDDDLVDMLVTMLHAMPETCALDCAAQDGLQLHEIGALLDLSKERVRQIIQDGVGTCAQSLMHWCE